MVQIRTLNDHKNAAIDLYSLFDINVHELDSTNIEGIISRTSAAFNRQRREFHPDSVSSYPKAVRDVATQIYQKLEEAAILLTPNGGLDRQDLASYVLQLQRIHPTDHPISDKMTMFLELKSGLQEIINEKRETGNELTIARKKLRDSERASSTTETEWRTKQYQWTQEKMTLSTSLADMIARGGNSEEVSERYIKARVAKNPESWLPKGFLHRKIQEAMPKQPKSKVKDKPHSQKHASRQKTYKSPILILTGGSASASRSITRAKEYINRGENEVTILYDETWHAARPSYRLTRVSKRNLDSITMDAIKAGRNVGSYLANLIALIKPREIHIQSNNLGNTQAAQLQRSPIRTIYFLDYIATPGKRGYKEGEESGILAASTVIIRTPDLLDQFNTIYSTQKDSRKIVIGKYGPV